MTHSPHDYPHLVARWRKVAKRAGLRLRKLTTAGGFDHFYLQSPKLGEAGGIYISAGIHGDEAAATEGLVTWAERNVTRLKKLPLLLFPCLNPWGLACNTRSDGAGRDLNRLFHDAATPVIGAVHRLIAGRQFSLALQLHEDYDGHGLYLYEVQRGRECWGEALLAAAAQYITIEPRRRIDGRNAKDGLIRRRIDHRRFAQIGYPEALWLHMHHSQRTFTIETPSEFALDQRIRAQVAIIDAAVSMAVNESANGPSDQGS